MEKVKQDHCQVIEHSGEGQRLGAIMSGDVEDSKVFFPFSILTGSYVEL